MFEFKTNDQTDTFSLWEIMMHDYFDTLIDLKNNQII